MQRSASQAPDDTGRDRFASGTGPRSASAVFVVRTARALHHRGSERGLRDAAGLGGVRRRGSVVARAPQHRRRHRSLGRAVVRADRPGGLPAGRRERGILPRVPARRSERSTWPSHRWERPAPHCWSSNVSFLGALIVLYALTAREWDTRRRSTDRRPPRVLPVELLLPRSLQRVAVSPRVSLLAFWWARGPPWGRGGDRRRWPPRSRAASGCCWCPRSWSKRGAKDRSGAIGAGVGDGAAGRRPLAYAAYWLGARPGTRCARSMRRRRGAGRSKLGRSRSDDALGSAWWGSAIPRGVYWTADLLLTVIFVAALAGSMACASRPRTSSTQG